MLKGKAGPGTLYKRFTYPGCNKIREADRKQCETNNDKTLFSPPESNKQSCEKKNMSGQPLSGQKDHEIIGCRMNQMKVQQLDSS